MFSLKEFLNLVVIATMVKKNVSAINFILEKNVLNNVVVMVQLITINVIVMKIIMEKNVKFNVQLNRSSGILKI